jgi:ABC-type multidrug transport system ATPase subunit/pSer/pThr/pTyr-binding forkhead associated (FHA) protein
MRPGNLEVRVNGREGVFSGALGEISFGHDESCVVRLGSPHVAPRHLLVRCVAGTWEAEPSGAAFLDGQRMGTLEIAEPLSLRLGDPVDGPLIELAPAREGLPSLATRDFAAAAAEEGVAPDSFPLKGDVVRLGRDPASDLVIEDLLASRRHAELRRRPGGGYEVIDLDSHNGTFVNGHRIERRALEQLDAITIGHDTYRLVGDSLERYVDTGEVAYAAASLSVTLPGGATLLDRVSFSLDSRSLLAIIGPSGSGKSTLMGALSGLRMPTAGDVRYDDQSLYGSYEALRRRIGFVPQEDVVHGELTVRAALDFAADLRFPPDTSASERRRRVEQVAAELGLGERMDVQVRRLSGGQRKRVSVALELLTEPSLLFLDEPTSGLDPNFERGVMQILRRLADGGRTVIVVTHSTQSLRLCDRVLVLAPGGRLAYFGPPQLVAAYFDRYDYADVFTELDEQAGEDWGERFRRHPYFAEYVERPRSAEPRPAPPPPAQLARSARTRGWWNQFSTLSRRYVAVLAADRRNLALMALQAPLLGLLMLAALPGGELAPTPASQLRLISQASLVLLVIVLGVTWLGLSNSVREIAKELPLFQRERAAGLSISAYVASKALVLGVITTLQAAVLIVLATAAQHGPRYASVLGWPLGELIAAGAMTGFAAMGLGLLISALSGSADRATTILPVVLVLQMVLALGGVFPQIGNRPVLKQLGYVSSTRWGFAASASTTDLNDLQEITGVLTRTPTVALSNPQPLFGALTRGARGEASWDHTAQAWLLDAAVLAALGMAALLGTGLALRRLDPGRRGA